MITYNKQDGINYVHDYVNKIDRSLEKLRNLNTPNSKKIIEFYKELKINGISNATQTKYLDRLSAILKWTNKDFDKLTRQEIIELVDKNLNQNKNYSLNTICSFRIILRKFYQWLKESPKGEYPNEVSWMRGSMDKSARHKNPEDMLNDDDIEKMVTKLKDMLFYCSMFLKKYFQQVRFYLTHI